MGRRRAVRRRYTSARGLTAVLAAASKEESMADGDKWLVEGRKEGRKEAPVSEGATSGVCESNGGRIRVGKE